MTALALLLIPVILIVFIIAAIQFNRFFLPLLPLVLLLLLFIFNAELMDQLFRLFVRHCLFWFLLALALSFVLRFVWPVWNRKSLRIGLCAAGLLLPAIALYWQAQQPIQPISRYEEITEAKLYRYQGDGVTLGTRDLAELKTFLASVTVCQDLMEESLDLTFNQNQDWYCMDAVLSDGESLRIALFPRYEDTDLMRLEMNGQRLCYQAIDDTADIGCDWISDKIRQTARSSVRKQYTEALSALKQSFTADGPVFSFILPEGLPADIEITIVGLPDSRNSVIYFLDEYNEFSAWTAGTEYSFDISEYASYRYIHLSVTIHNEEFDLINIFEYLPEEMQSQNPQKRFSDSEI